MATPTRPLRPTIPPAPTRRGVKVHRLIGVTWGAGDPAATTPTGTASGPASGPGGSDGPAEENNRGEWRIDTQYQAGDIFTYKGELFRVKKAHTSVGGGATPSFVDIPGIAQSYYERI